MRLPKLPSGHAYQIIVNTGDETGNDHGDSVSQQPLTANVLTIGARSVILCRADRI